MSSQFSYTTKVGSVIPQQKGKYVPIPPNNEMSKRGTPRGDIETFYGIILNTKDITTPSTGKIRMEMVKFAVIEFTQIPSSSGPINTTTTTVSSETGKRKLVGTLPFIQLHVVYQMLIQETYMDDKYKYSWKIKSYCTSPNYANPVSMSKFILQFAGYAWKKDYDKLHENQDTEIDKKLKKQELEIFQKGINREIKKFTDNRNVSATVDPTQEEWNEFLKLHTFGTTALSFVNPRENGNNALPDYETYAHLNMCYHTSLFADNSFWNEMKDDVKNEWENQFDTVEKAFDMSARQRMPPNLRFLNQKSFTTNSSRDQDLEEELEFSFLKRYENAHKPDFKEITQESMVVVGKKRKNETEKENPYNSLQVNLQKQLAAFLQHLKLNQAQYNVHTEMNSGGGGGGTTDYQKRFHFVPELSLTSFKNLCFRKKWVGEPLQPNEYGIIDTRITYIPLLNQYMLAIQCYQYIQAFLLRQNECAIRFSQVPQTMRPALDFLVQRKILFELSFVPPSLSCEESEKEEDEKEQAREKHYYLNIYALLKMTLVEYLKSFAQHKPLGTEYINRSKIQNPEMWDVNQLKFLDMVQQHTIFAINSGPGKGKTECLKLLDQCAPRGTVTVVGFAGKAVVNVRKRIKRIECSTIHSLMIQPGIKSGKHQIPVLHIEESSMPSELLFMQLMAVVRCNQLILSGDVNQIPAFCACRGAFFRELLNIYPTLKLETNYRQLKHPENKIIPNLQHILNNDFDKIEWDAKTFRIRPFEMGVKNLIEIHAKNYFNDFIFLCSLNQHVADLNHRVLMYLVPNHRHKGDRELVLNTFFPKDQIMLLKNTYRSVQYDRLDMYFNAQFYYQSSGYMEYAVQKQQKNDKSSSIKYTCKAWRHETTVCCGSNGEVDQIKAIYHIRDSRRLEAILEKLYIHHLQENPPNNQLEEQFYNSSSEGLKKHKGNDDNSQDELKDGETVDNKSFEVDETPQIKIFDPYLHFSEWKSYVTLLPEVTRALYQNKREQQAYNNQVLIQFESGRHVMLSDLFQHAYAATIEKFQGSEKPRVAVSLQDLKNSDWLRKEFTHNKFYTGASRPIQELTVLANSLEDVRYVMNNRKHIVCGLAHFF